MLLKEKKLIHPREASPPIVVTRVGSHSVTCIKQGGIGCLSPGFDETVTEKQTNSGFRRNCHRQTNSTNTYLKKTSPSTADNPGTTVVLPRISTRLDHKQITTLETHPPVARQRFSLRCHVPLLLPLQKPGTQEPPHPRAHKKRENRRICRILRPVRRTRGTATYTLHASNRWGDAGGGCTGRSSPSFDANSTK